MGRDGGGVLTVKSDPPRLQTFVNTRLGEAYEDRDTAPIEAERLLSRCEPFGEILPDEVALITAGVDTQDDRLELEIVGWGKGEESWSLDYQVLWGDPAFPEVWKQLDAVLLQRYPHVRDVPPLPISAVAIDSGGHRTPNVMEYVQPRQNRRVWAIKGRGGPGIPAWPKRPPKLKAGQLAPLYIVGVDSLKHTLISRLRIETASAGYCHFPEGERSGLLPGHHRRKARSGVQGRCCQNQMGGRQRCEERAAGLSGLCQCCAAWIGGEWSNVGAGGEGT